MQQELVDAIEEAAEAIDVEVFDEFPVEEDVSFADWVAQRGFWDHPFSQAVCSQLSSSIVGREPHEIGAHYFFDYIKSGNGLQKSLLSAGQDGAQQLMVKEGQYTCHEPGPRGALWLCANDQQAPLRL